MRYALITHNTVVNVIVAGPDFAASVGAVACPDGVSIGWQYSAGQFMPPLPAPAAVPQFVTRRQAKQALILGGLIAGIQPAIDAIPDPIQRALIQCEWDDSQVFERDRPALIALGGALGLSSAQLDALFISAAAL